ncbi:MAG TPA: hypothetical protein VL854_02435 [Nitrososphaeraceae archaeon]|nr:hypothetical protein [Nitrososphaeraceae archaeon]
MDKISSSSSYTKLDGKVEDDEFYIKVGSKGRSYHDEIVKSAGRKPRKRGLKPLLTGMKYVDAFCFRNSKLFIS